MPARKPSSRTIIAGVASAAAIALAVVLYLRLSAPPSGFRAVAVPDAVGQAEVLAAFRSEGVSDALCSSNATLPLSDFSRLVLVSFDDADRRVREGDPRETPLLAALRTAFRASARDRSSWNVYYVPSPGASRDEAIARALDGLGVEWASDAPPAKGAPTGARRALFALPALAWGLWLAFRRPRRDRAFRLLLAAAWLPLVLFRPGAAAACLCLAGQAASSIYYLRSPRGRSDILSSVLSLWPYAVSASALILADAGALPAFALSLALSALAIRAEPRIVALTRRGRLHPPPLFVPLTVAGAAAPARAIAGRIAAPAVAVLALALLAPAGPRADGVAGLRMQPNLSADTDMLLEHIAFQRALTLGRIGEAAWGEASYTEAYRYVEESGTMRRVEEPAAAGVDEENRALLEASTVALLAKNGLQGASVVASAANVGGSGVARLDIKAVFFYIIASVPMVVALAREIVGPGRSLALSR